MRILLWWLKGFSTKHKFENHFFLTYYNFMNTPLNIPGPLALFKTKVKNILPFLSFSNIFLSFGYQIKFILLYLEIKIHCFQNTLVSDLMTANHVKRSS